MHVEELFTAPQPMECGTVSRPLKIALVYGRTPMPMRRADQMTVSHLLAFLKARGHIVDLFYIDTGGIASARDKEWIRSVCRNVYAFEASWLQIAVGLLKQLSRGRPVQVGLFSHPVQRRSVCERVTTEGYDLLYTYYFRSAEITRDLGRTHNGIGDAVDRRPVSILAMQLSQTLNAGRIAKNAPNTFLRWFYAIESKLVERYEARIWRHFTRVALIGESDVSAVKRACIRHRQEVISNYFFSAHGTNVQRFKPQDDHVEISNHLVFSGVMRTPTNVQAVQWFAKEVWPAVKTACPDATWSIVGREPVAEVLELGKLEGVTVTGTVDDPAAYMRSASICINPMQAGGGMQNKLIEYMASGKAIVATPVANEGILAPPSSIWIAEDPDDFAHAVITLLTDRERAKEFGSRAREHALKNWTWEAHFLKLEQQMSDLVGRPLN